MKISVLESSYKERRPEASVLAPPCGSCTCTCCCSSAIGLPEMVLLLTHKGNQSLEVSSATFPTESDILDPENTVKVESDITPQIASSMQIKGFLVGLVLVGLNIILMLFLLTFEYLFYSLLIIFLLLLVGILGYPILVYYKLEKSYSATQRLKTSIKLFFKAILLSIVGGILEFILLVQLSIM